MIKYYALTLADNNTPALRRKFNIMPELGGRFNQDFTKMIVKISDPAIQREIPARELMDKDEAKALLETDAWNNHNFDLAPPDKSDTLPLIFQTESYADIKNQARSFHVDFRAVLNHRVRNDSTDATRRTRLEGAGMSAQQITDFLTDRSGGLIAQAQAFTISDKVIDAQKDYTKTQPYSLWTDIKKWWWLGALGVGLGAAYWKWGEIVSLWNRF